MKIAVEATLASAPCPTGLGVYLDNLLRGFAADPEFAENNTFYLLYAGKEWKGGNYGRNFVPVSYRFTPSRFAATLFYLDSVIRKTGAEVFHAPCSTGIPPRCSVPSVCTVHDIFPLTMKGIPLKQRVLAKILFSWAFHNADCIICNSESTKRELAEFGIRADDFPVIYPGTQFDFDKILPRIPAKPPFFLCTGALEHRKGQLMLADAYLEALQSENTLPNLVFAGPDRGDASAMMERVARSCGKILYPGYIEKEELLKLYAGAEALFCPGFSEGFGIPVIEGMKTGVPVICSDLAVFHEIAENGAVFVPPVPEMFRKAILDFVHGKLVFPSEEARKRILTRFDWHQTAAQTMAIYRDVCSGC